VGPGEHPTAPGLTIPVPASRLRVEHLITKLELGGAQQNTLYCVAHHDRRKYRVSLAAGPGGVLDRDARGIRDAALHWFPSLRREIRPVRDLRFLLEYRAHLRRERIDILHTHSSKAGILGRLAAGWAGVPVVIHTVHGWGFHDFQRAPVRALYVALERLAVRYTDLLIAVSGENVERGIRAGIGRRGLYRVIRSGIDPREFTRPTRARASVRRSLGIPARARVVITVGNFKPQKAPLDFVRAAATVARAVPGAWFVMCGDGELKQAARELGNELGLGDRLVMPGWRRDIPDLLHASDVFALSSLFEGLPRSVLQAAVAGLPVVATAVSGTPEAVREGVTGRLVPARRPDAMAARLVELLRSPRRARMMGRAGRRLIGREFDIRVMLEQIEDAYDDLANRKLAGLAGTPFGSSDSRG